MRIYEQMMLYFGDFLDDPLLSEGVVNDFNKFISRSSKVFIILAGSPRSGKSWVAENYIVKKVRNIVTINPDDISLVFTKDHNKYYSPSTQLSVKRTKNLLKKRKDDAVFIYDSTGFDLRRISSLSKRAKESGYQIVVLNVFAPLKETVERNKEAERHVDEDYLIKRWKHAQENIKKIDKSVQPDDYYVVINSYNKQHWYTYKNGKITR